MPDVTLCRCGCGEPARPGAAFASTQCSNKHRRKTWDQYHPRLDLSGLPLDVALRCTRMAEEAVRAAREGLSRATVDSSKPVKHERDKRLSCRLRLSPTVFSIVDEMAANGWGAGLGGSSRSAITETMILKEYERWKGGGNAAQETGRD